MLLLTKKRENKYKKQKFYYICKEEFNEVLNEDKNYPRVQDHCHFTGNFQGVLIVSVIYEIRRQN